MEFLPIWTMFRVSVGFVEHLEPSMRSNSRTVGIIWRPNDACMQLAPYHGILITFQLPYWSFCPFRPKKSMFRVSVGFVEHLESFVRSNSQAVGLMWCPNDACMQLAPCHYSIMEFLPIWTKEFRPSSWFNIYCLSIGTQWVDGGKGGLLTQKIGNEKSMRKSPHPNVPPPRLSVLPHQSNKLCQHYVVHTHHVCCSTPWTQIYWVHKVSHMHVTCTCTWYIISFTFFIQYRPSWNCYQLCWQYLEWNCFLLTRLIRICLKNSLAGYVNMDGLTRTPQWRKH